MRVISPDGQLLNPKPRWPASQGKQTTIVMIQDFGFSLRQLGLFPANQKRIAALASTCVSATTKNEPQGRQNSKPVTSAIMMSAPGEGPERIAEILREILALSGTEGSNRSKSTGADDSIKLSDTQSESAIQETCASGENRQARSAAIPKIKIVIASDGAQRARGDSNTRPTD